jgi:hypothetical protein
MLSLEGQPNPDPDTKSFGGGFAPVFFVPGTLVRTWGTRPISSNVVGGIRLRQTEVRSLENGGSGQTDLGLHNVRQTLATWSGPLPIGSPPPVRASIAVVQVR